MEKNDNDNDNNGKRAGAYDDLHERAARHYPGSIALQEKWIAAVAYLRSRSKWVLEGGSANWSSYRV